LVAVWGTSGCIRQEQSWSFVLRSDGKVDLTLHQAQVRSSEKSVEERYKEERKWLRDLRRASTPEQEGLKRALATGIRRTIHRDHAPFSVTTQARLPSVEAIAKLVDLKAPEGEIVLETLIPKKKRLILRLTGPKAISRESFGPNASPTPEDFDTPHWTFAPEKGRIVESELCTLTPDRGACRLDILGLDQAQKRAQGGSAQASVTWEHD
jgi:hypothetical protein